VMILSGQQPNYLPWIGLFAKIAQSDRFAIVDHVQYIRRSVITRNKILGVDGEPIQLTVPVLTHGRGDQRIVEVEIDEHEPWRRKHFKSLRFCYRGAPFWSEHAPFFEDIYGRRWDRLADLNAAILEYHLGAFGLDVACRRTSELDIVGAKTEMLVSMCRAFDCGTYLSGAGAKKYVDESVFVEAGLSHRFQEFTHPTYAQGKRPEFVSHLSAIDLLFWCGPEAGRIIRGET
jgi:WbqC-like protein family